MYVYSSCIDTTVMWSQGEPRGHADGASKANFSDVKIFAFIPFLNKSLKQINV